MWGKIVCVDIWQFNNPAVFRTWSGRRSRWYCAQPGHSSYPHPLPHLAGRSPHQRSVSCSCTILLSSVVGHSFNIALFCHSPHNWATATLTNCHLPSQSALLSSINSHLLPRLLWSRQIISLSVSQSCHCRYLIIPLSSIISHSLSFKIGYWLSHSNIIAVKTLTMTDALCVNVTQA